MNINQLAKLITEIEGKKQQVNIAQVKEVLAIIRKLMRENIEIDSLMRRSARRSKK